MNHFVPSTKREALEILSKNNCTILAGGTDLLLQKYRSSGLLPTFETRSLKPKITDWLK